MSVGVVVLVAVLFYYKYFAWALGVVDGVLGTCFSPVETILAPLGISFITFSGISYIVDVHRGRSGVGNLLDVALYLTFFPKVVSGPIALWRDFAPQLQSRSHRASDVVAGLNLFVLGFAKKVLIADTLGAALMQMGGTVDTVTAWWGAFLFTLQIYYDFAGYSDIAIGMSRLFGFRIKENFNFPYTSLAIAEFWRRWHISLGEWFKEYLYFPLGGSRRGQARTLVNLGVVFLITGIWHGAGFGYLFWGMMHGACRVFEKWSEGRPWWLRTPSFVKYTLTMLVVMVGWQFFRFGTFSATFAYFKSMLGLMSHEWLPYTWEYFMTLKLVTVALLGVLGATLLRAQLFKRLLEHAGTSRPLFALQQLLLLALFVLSVTFMVSAGHVPFIYFRY